MTRKLIALFFISILAACTSNPKAADNGQSMNRHPAADPEQQTNSNIYKQVCAMDAFANVRALFGQACFYVSDAGLSEYQNDNFRISEKSYRVQRSCDSPL